MKMLNKIKLLSSRAPLLMCSAIPFFTSLINLNTPSSNNPIHDIPKNPSPIIPDPKIPPTDPEVKIPTYIPSPHNQWIDFKKTVVHKENNKNSEWLSNLLSRSPFNKLIQHKEIQTLLEEIEIFHDIRFDLYFNEHIQIMINLHTNEKRYETIKFTNLKIKIYNSHDINHLPEGWNIITDKNVEIQWLSTWTGDWLEWKNEKKDQKWISAESWARSSFSSLIIESNLKNWHYFKQEFKEWYGGPHIQFSTFIYLFNKTKPEEIIPIWWTGKKDQGGIKDISSLSFTPETKVLTFDLPTGIDMVQTSWKNFLIIDSVPFWIRVATANLTGNYDFWLGEPSLTYKNENGKIENIYYDRFISPLIFEALQLIFTAGLFNELKLSMRAKESVEVTTRTLNTERRALQNLLTRKQNLSNQLNELRNISLPKWRTELTQLEEKLKNGWLRFKGTEPEYQWAVKRKDFLKDQIRNAMETVIPGLEREFGEVLASIGIKEGTIARLAETLDRALQGVEKVLTWFQSKLKDIITWLIAKMVQSPILRVIAPEIADYFAVIIAEWTVKTVGNLLGFLLFNNLYSSYIVTVPLHN